MEEENIIKTRKIRIFPTKSQKTLFNKCIGANRYYYNKALDFIKKNPKEKINFINIRKKVLISNKDLDEKDLWQKEIPYDTRQLSIKKLIEAYKSNFSKKEKFNMHFKSKKRSNNIFYVNKKALKDNFVIFSQITKKRSIRSRRKCRSYLKNKEWGDFQIMKDKANRWYLILPIKNQRKIIKNINKEKIVALDPGEITFQTFYSTDKFGKLGDNIDLTLDHYNEKIDKYNSLSQNKNLRSKTRYNARKRCNLLRTKVRNIVRDLHWKSANYLCKNYEVILLPSFQTQNMIQKKSRKIGKGTSRKLLTLSHYLFKQRLLEKSKDLNSVVVEVNEAYTSKTCGNCGSIQKVDRTYNCKKAKCDMIADRDINAARNIYIRYLTYINNRVR